MAVRNNTNVSTGGQFTADKDYFGETEDGRSFLKVANGVTIPMSEAVALGVVKGEKPAKDAEPTDESKSQEPTTNKSAAPGKNKGGDNNG